MKIILYIMFLFGSLANAGEKELPVPSWDELRAIVGKAKDSKELAEFIKKYKFREEFKDEDAWTSRIGIYINASGDGLCRVGIRPEICVSDDELLVELPNKLSSKDTIDDVVGKMGNPLKTKHNPDRYYEMHYKGIKLTFIRGSLFEIWLLPE